MFVSQNYICVTTFPTNVAKLVGCVCGGGGFRGLYNCKAQQLCEVYQSFIGFAQTRFPQFDERKFTTEMNLIRNGIRQNLRKKGQFPAPHGSPSHMQHLTIYVVKACNSQGMFNG